MNKIKEDLRDIYREKIIILTDEKIILLAKIFFEARTSFTAGKRYEAILKILDFQLKIKDNIFSHLKLEEDIIKNSLVEYRLAAAKFFLIAEYGEDIRDRTQEIEEVFCL